MIKSFFYKIIVNSRRLKYSLLSSNKLRKGKILSHQPILLRGKGIIDVGEGVEIGVINSPFFLNGYAYLEARQSNSHITIGNHVKINNNFCIVANESNIVIEDNVLIGFNCQIINSDFHSLDPTKRNSGVFESKPVHISENVFIGNNVTILKGISIGKNSVIAAGSLVVNNIPDNVVAGGNPAKVLSKLILL